MKAAGREPSGEVRKDRGFSRKSGRRLGLHQTALPLEKFHAKEEPEDSPFRFYFCAAGTHPQNASAMGPLGVVFRHGFAPVPVPSVAPSAFASDLLDVVFLFSVPVGKEGAIGFDFVEPGP